MIKFNLSPKVIALSLFGLLLMALVSSTYHYRNSYLSQIDTNIKLKSEIKNKEANIHALQTEINFLHVEAKRKEDTLKDLRTKLEEYDNKYREVENKHQQELKEADKIQDPVQRQEARSTANIKAIWNAFCLMGDMSKSPACKQ